MTASPGARRVPGFRCVSVLSGWIALKIGGHADLPDSAFENIRVTANIPA